MFWKEIGNWFKNAWNSVKTWASNTFGAESSTVYQKYDEKEIVSGGLNCLVTVKAGTRGSTTVSKRGDSSKPVSVYAQARSDKPILSSAGVKFNIVDLTLDISLGLDNLGISGSLLNGDTTSTFSIHADVSQLKVGLEFASTIKWDENTHSSNYTNCSVTGVGIIAACVFATTGVWVSSASPLPA